MYQAMVRSGAGVVSGLKPVGATEAGALAPEVASWPMMPVAGSQASVSGVSADNDKAPRKPHGASGIV